MKKKLIILLVSICFLTTGCTKYLSDDNKKRVIINSLIYNDL